MTQNMNTGICENGVLGLVEHIPPENIDPQNIDNSIFNLQGKR